MNIPPITSNAATNNPDPNTKLAIQNLTDVYDNVNNIGQDIEIINNPNSTQDEIQQATIDMEGCQQDAEASFSNLTSPPISGALTKGQLSALQGIQEEFTNLMKENPLNASWTGPMAREIKATQNALKPN